MNNRISKIILSLTWLSALAGLGVISYHFAGESTQFSGIADDQEQTILFTTPVEIARYGFVAGQQVEAGELIVEVRNPVLDALLQTIDDRIAALRLGNREDRASMSAQMVQLRADLNARLTEIDSELRSLENRRAATRDLLAAIGQNAAADGDDALAREIDGLQLRKQALRRATAAQVDDLNARLSMPERSVDAQIAELQNNRLDLQRQQTDLTVHAQLRGRVGSILFKVGAMVPPYQPVLTIHGSGPTFVKGYIHEDVRNTVQLAQTVWVRSASSTNGAVWHAGSVESLGSRIVEFPQRLKVNPLAQAWGREVVINLRDGHALLLGEKVEVQVEQPANLLHDVRALVAQYLP